jgi:imidazolonepropionase-like amidohydrolase
MVIPPLCDHHVHFFDSSPEALRTVKKALTSSGIVRVHDGGSASCHGLRAKKHFGQSLEIKSCGYALYKKGGYGTFLGKGIETLNEARAAIDKLSKLNVDYLKVINSGIVDITTGDITDGGFEKDELRDIIDYAADRGLSVYCHASGDNAVRGAVEAGASTIVHGFSISDDTVALMKERDVSLIPTVAALFRLRDVEGSVESGSAIERLTKAHMRAIRKASEAGVTILPGSDAGPDLLPYGITFLEELSFLQKAGLPIEIILASATTGIIRAGAKADFVVLDGLPDDKASISVIDRFAFSDV